VPKPCRFAHASGRGRSGLANAKKSHKAARLGVSTVWILYGIAAIDVIRDGRGALGTGGPMKLSERDLRRSIDSSKQLQLPS